MNKDKSGRSEKTTRDCPSSGRNEKAESNSSRHSESSDYLESISDLPTIRLGRTRPSSWDDSDGEVAPKQPKSQNSRIYSGDSKKSGKSISSEIQEIKAQFFRDLKNEREGKTSLNTSTEEKNEWKEDRRQSLARIRRRTKSSSSSSPVLDAKNQSKAEEAEVLEENYDSRKGLEMDSKVFLDKFFADLRSKKINLVSLYNDGVLDRETNSVYGDKDHQNRNAVEIDTPRDFFDEDNIFSNRTCRKLSKILEVEEINSKKDMEVDEKREDIPKLFESCRMFSKSPTKYPDWSPLTTPRSGNLGNNEVNNPNSYLSTKTTLGEKFRNFEQDSKSSQSDEYHHTFGTEEDKIISLTPKSGQPMISLGEWVGQSTEQLNSSPRTTKSIDNDRNNDFKTYLVIDLRKGVSDAPSPRKSIESSCPSERSSEGKKTERSSERNESPRFKISVDSARSLKTDLVTLQSQGRKSVEGENKGKSLSGESSPKKSGSEKSSDGLGELRSVRLQDITPEPSVRDGGSGKSHKSGSSMKEVGRRSQKGERQQKMYLNDKSSKKAVSDFDDIKDHSHPNTPANSSRSSERSASFLIHDFKSPRRDSDSGKSTSRRVSPKSVKGLFPRSLELGEDRKDTRTAGLSSRYGDQASPKSDSLRIPGNTTRKQAEEDKESSRSNPRSSRRSGKGYEISETENFETGKCSEFPKGNTIKSILEKDDYKPSSRAGSIKSSSRSRSGQWDDLENHVSSCTKKDKHSESRKSSSRSSRREHVASGNVETQGRSSKPSPVRNSAKSIKARRIPNEQDENQESSDTAEESQKSRSSLREDNYYRGELEECSKSVRGSPGKYRNFLGEDSSNYNRTRRKPQNENRPKSSDRSEKLFPVHDGHLKTGGSESQKSSARSVSNEQDAVNLLDEIERQKNFFEENLKNSRRSGKNVSELYQKHKRLVKDRYDENQQKIQIEEFDSARVLDAEQDNCKLSGRSGKSSSERRRSKDRPSSKISQDEIKKSRQKIEDISINTNTFKRTDKEQTTLAYYNSLDPSSAVRRNESQESIQATVESPAAASDRSGKSQNRFRNSGRRSRRESRKMTKGGFEIASDGTQYNLNSLHEQKEKLHSPKRLESQLNLKEDAIKPSSQDNSPRASSTSGSQSSYDSIDIKKTEIGFECFYLKGMQKEGSTKKYEKNAAHRQQVLGSQKIESKHSEEINVLFESTKSKPVRSKASSAKSVASTVKSENHFGSDVEEIIDSGGRFRSSGNYLIIEQMDEGSAAASKSMKKNISSSLEKENSSRVTFVEREVDVDAKSSGRSVRSSLSEDIEEKSGIESHRSRAAPESGRSSNRKLSIINEVSFEDFQKNNVRLNDLENIFKSRPSSDGVSEQSTRSKNSNKKSSVDMNKGKGWRRDLKLEELWNTECEKSKLPSDRSLGSDLSEEFRSGRQSRKLKSKLDPEMWTDLIETFDDSAGSGKSSYRSQDNSEHSQLGKNSDRKISQENSTTSDAQKIISKNESEDEIPLQTVLWPRRRRTPKKITDEKSSGRRFQEQTNAILKTNILEKQTGLKDSSEKPKDTGNTIQQWPKNMFYCEVGKRIAFGMGEGGDVTCWNVGESEITKTEKPRDHGDGNEEQKNNWEMLTLCRNQEEGKKESNTQRLLWTDLKIGAKHMNNMWLSREKECLQEKFFIPYGLKPSKSDNCINTKTENLDLTPGRVHESRTVLKENVEKSDGSRINKKTPTSKCIARKSTSSESDNKSSVRKSISSDSIQSLNEVQSARRNSTSNVHTKAMDEETAIEEVEGSAKLFQTRSKEEKECTNLNIFLANKNQDDEISVKENNWLILPERKSKKFKFNCVSKFRGGKRHVASREKHLSSRRSRTTVPPLKLGINKSGCLQNFYKRVISVFCLTSTVSSATTSK